MKKLLIFFIFIIILLIVFSLFLDPVSFFSNIIATLELWLYKVYPSIFTFYILASLLINSKIINKIIYLFSPVFKHLKFPNEYALHLFFLSAFTGNPTSASLICEAIDKNEITSSEANNLLKCSSFLNPLFIVSFMLAFAYKFALAVIAVHICSNLIIAIWVNRKNNLTPIHNTNVKFLLDRFLKSVNNVIFLLLMISGIMVLSNILKFSISSLLNFFSINYTFFEVLLANIEVSLGLNSLILLGMGQFITVLLISFVSSFGGLSIHLQVINVIGKYKLSYRTFFIYRIIQGILSCILLALIYWLF